MTSAGVHTEGAVDDDRIGPADVRCLLCAMQAQARADASAPAVITRAVITRTGGSGAGTQDPAGSDPTARVVLDRGALHHRVAAAATALHEAGVRRGDAVGAVADRSANAVVILLACWSVGARWVPVDPTTPREITTQLLLDLDVDVLLIDPVDVARVSQLGVRCVLLPAGTPAAQPVLTPSDLAHRCPEPLSSAAVLHTSGSTGTPKAVDVGHAGLANRVWWGVRTLGLGPEDRVLVKTAFTFDACLWEILGGLVSGAALVIVPPGGELDVALIADHIATERITVLQGVPSWWRAVLSGSGSAALGVRIVSSAGERLDGALVARLANRFPSARIVNTYGPVECSIDVCAHEIIDPAVVRAEDDVPLGSAIDGLRVAVLDTHRNPVVDGRSGEIAVAGVGLGSGYPGRPRWTADRFVPDPQGPPGARRYLTGDRGHVTDGLLYFAGRIDSQVKVRGVRTELDPIDGALRRLPHVRAAIAALETTNGAPTAVVAHLVVGPEFDPDSARESLGTRFSGVQLPSRWELHDALPLTSSGKIDRAALTVEVTAEPVDEPPRTAPALLSEPDLLAAEISTIVGREIPVDGTWPEHGVHSLALMRLASTLSRRIGCEVPVRVLFDHDTPRRLAVALQEVPPDTVEVPADHRTDPGAASALEEALWMAHRVETAPRSAGGARAGGALPEGLQSYRVDWGVDLRPAASPSAVARTADLARVRATCAALVDHTPALRLLFHLDGNGHLRRRSDPEAAVEYADGWGDPEPPRGSAPNTKRVPDSALGLDPEHGPLARWSLTTAADGTLQLRLVTHHIAVDGTSEQLLVDRFCALLEETEPSNDPGARPDRRDHPGAGAQHARPSDDDREYWATALRTPGRDPLSAPLGDPEAAADRRLRTRLPLPADVVEEVGALARRAGCTPFTVWLSAVGSALASISGVDAARIGTVVDCRPPEAADTVGDYANLVPMVVGGGGAGTLLDRVEITRQAVRGAIEHRALPYPEIVRMARSAGIIAAEPLVRCTFGVPTPLHGHTVGGFDVVPVQAERAPAPFDLSVFLVDGVDGPQLEIDHRPAAISGAAVRCLTDALVAGIRQGAGAARRAGPDPLDGDLLAPILERILAADSAAAVLDGAGVRIADLAGRVDRIVQSLRSAGVRPGHVVAALTGRSFETVLCELAVLSAGATWAPLDPNQPAERLRDQLALLAPRLLVADPDPTRPTDFGPDPRSHRVTVRTSAQLEQPSGRHRGPGRATVTRGLPSGLPAYVLFTSGSTGAPKAVAVSRLSLADHCAPTASLYRMRPSDRILLTSPPTFDPSMEQTVAALAAGMEVVVADQLDRPAEILRAITRHRISHLALAAPVFREVLWTAELSGAPLDTTSMRTIAVGGDVLRPGDVLRWRALTTSNPLLLNVFGLTESTITSCAHDTTPVTGLDPSDPSASVPIGRPLPGVTASVRRPDLEPCAVGEQGELCLSGTGLALGYLGDAAATAAAFVPDPDRVGGRLLRTGDRATSDAGGTITLLGRMDRRLKVNGRRVSPGEIEDLLITQPGVDEVVVSTEAGHSGSTLLGHYVGTADPDELRAMLRGRLPEHLVPDGLVPVPRLVKTAAGKVDPVATAASALAHREPTGIDPDGLSDHAGPSTPAGDPPGWDPPDEVHAAIARAWTLTLGVPVRSPDRSFFDLGGTSLSATRLHALLERSFNLSIPLEMVFSAATISDQVGALEALIDGELDQVSGGAR